MAEQVTPNYDTSRLQNDLRSIDELLADDAAAEAMEKSKIGIAAIECTMIRADIFWIASKKLAGRQRSADGKVRTLADFAAIRQTTYNTANLLIRLAPFKAWVRAQIKQGQLDADQARKAYQAPHWKTFVGNLPGAKPSTTKRTRTRPDKPKPAEPLPEANAKIAELERQLAAKPAQPQQIVYNAPSPPSPEYDWQGFFQRFAKAGEVLARWVQRAKAENRFDMADLAERCEEFWAVLVPDDLSQMPLYDGQEFDALGAEFTEPLLALCDACHYGDETDDYLVFIDDDSDTRLVFLSGSGFLIRE